MPLSRRRQSELDDGEKIKLLYGDCRQLLTFSMRQSFDSVVTDPPYGLEFMGKSWDKQVPGPDYWRKILTVLKPGGYMLAMGGTRTYHRLACAIEDSGFEIRDCLMWLYGQGFPKGKGNLKPAHEPILLARRPGPKVLPLGVDECRVPTKNTYSYPNGRGGSPIHQGGQKVTLPAESHPGGRYPANVVHDGSDEVLEAFAEFGESGTTKTVVGGSPRANQGQMASRYDSRKARDRSNSIMNYGDSGSVARFFYCAKPTTDEKGTFNSHPTVKPVALMRWLVRLVTPSGGRVLDPFAGSGTTLIAAMKEGLSATGIELSPTNYEIARLRTYRRS